VKSRKLNTNTLNEKQYITPSFMYTKFRWNSFYHSTTASLPSVGLSERKTAYLPGKLCKHNTDYSGMLCQTKSTI